ncbi:MAG: TRAP transporter large permease subunit [Thermodesulfobacteriota bacterium]|nr:TRAP transporter large permease subunit [Thermodesulfobacteriota bacterium]
MFLFFKFSRLMITTSGESIWLALGFTMFASLILGCGLPTTAAYVVLATMVVPALIKIGVPVLPAHLFVFYFGCISTITPPVALSAYAAGAIAGANPNRVGWTAFKFSLVAFIIPYIYVDFWSRSSVGRARFRNYSDRNHQYHWSDSLCRRLAEIRLGGMYLAGANFRPGGRNFTHRAESNHRPTRRGLDLRLFFFSLPEVAS